MDSEPLAGATYRMNHPKVRHWEQDIRALTVEEVQDTLGLEPGRLDLLAGCPPCQGFSSLRTLNGGRDIADMRNDLVFEYVRFALALRPKALMMENVPGLAQDPRLEQVLRSLRAVGYHCSVAVLDAADYGVPQRRRRMLLLAGQGRSIPFAPRATTPATVADAIASLPLPHRSDDPLHNYGEQRSDHIRRLIAAIPKNGGSRTALPADQQLDCHRRCDGFHDIYGRMSWDSQAPTITTGCINPSKGRFLHPEQDRAITLREAALLQTFPETYGFSMKRGKYSAAVMIGNALPPKFVRAHALQVKRHLRVASNA